MSDAPNLAAVLRRYWGYHEFRPKQENVIRSLLAARDTCVVMPTGGGKSLCYQLPAVISGKTAVVVSPLIALMQDQAAQLAQMGIPAAAINSMQSSAERRAVMEKAARGEYRLLYLSPERLRRKIPSSGSAKCRSAFLRWMRRIAFPSGDTNSVPTTGS